MVETLVTPIASAPDGSESSDRGREVVFAALDNGFSGVNVGPYFLGDTFEAYLYLMPVVPFAESFREPSDLFTGIERLDGPDRAIWFPTPLGAAYTTVPNRADEPSAWALHIRSPQVVASLTVPPECFPFHLQIDRIRDVFCEWEPTYDDAAFRWLPATTFATERQDFRPTDSTIRGSQWPPPAGRPVASVLDVTLLRPSKAART